MSTLLQIIGAANRAFVGSGLVCHLDAGHIDSYSGSGTTWKNLVASPADSETQSTYDFTTSGLTFNGTAGALSATESFSTAGAGRATLAANTTFTNSLHKNNAAFTFFFVMTTPSALANGDGLLGTSSFTIGDVGFSLISNNSGRPQFQTRDGPNVDYNETSLNAKFGTSDLEMYAWSFNEATGSNGGLWYHNDGTKTTDTETSTYLAPTTSNATHIMQLFTSGNSQDPLSSGWEMHQFLMYNRFLSATELDTNFTALRPRYGI